MEERIITWSGFVFHLRGTTLKDRFDWKSLHGKTLWFKVNINPTKTSKPLKGIRKQRRKRKIWKVESRMSEISFVLLSSRLKFYSCKYALILMRKRKKVFFLHIKKEKFLPIVHVFLCRVSLNSFRGVKVARKVFAITLKKRRAKLSSYL